MTAIKIIAIKLGYNNRAIECNNLKYWPTYMKINKTDGKK